MPKFRKWLFETLYKNRYLYRLASTVPFAGQWRIWQRLVLPRLQGTDVLELGCGLGDLLADMLQEGYTCQAVEHSPQMVAAARATLKRRKVGHAAMIMQGDAQRLPFPATSFDTVVSTFPSEYIYDPDTLAQVERVLRPGGRLIVIEGANLLSIGFIQPLLVIIQMLVYGSDALFGPRKRRNLNAEMARSRNNDTGIITDELPNAWFGQHISVEQCGLQRHSERIRSQRWEVYMIIAEKKS